MLGKGQQRFSCYPDTVTKGFALSKFEPEFGDPRSEHCVRFELLVCKLRRRNAKQLPRSEWLEKDPKRQDGSREGKATRRACLCAQEIDAGLDGAPA